MSHKDAILYRSGPDALSYEVVVQWPRAVAQPQECDVPTPPVLRQTSVAMVPPRTPTWRRWVQCQCVRQPQELKRSVYWTARTRGCHNCWLPRVRFVRKSASCSGEITWVKPWGERWQFCLSKTDVTCMASINRCVCFGYKMSENSTRYTAPSLNVMFLYCLFLSDKTVQNPNMYKLPSYVRKKGIKSTR